MSEVQTPVKTVVEIQPETHLRLREGAARTSNSLKRFTALLLDYALAKFEAGEIALREPTIEEVPTETEAAK
jgi:hypothetical protein